VEKELAQESDEDIYMLKCSHKYHMACLMNLIGENKWAKCPVCSMIFGKMAGDQPEGTMTVNYDKHTTLPGHSKGSIII
jgi:deltex